MNKFLACFLVGFFVIISFGTSRAATIAVQPIGISVSEIELSGVVYTMVASRFSITAVGEDVSVDFIDVGVFGMNLNRAIGPHLMLTVAGPNVFPVNNVFRIQEGFTGVFDVNYTVTVNMDSWVNFDLKRIVWSDDPTGTTYHQTIYSNVWSEDVWIKGPETVVYPNGPEIVLPEPSTSALFFLGLAGFIRRRRT